MLEKTPESPFDSKEIKPANPKGDRSWMFIGRTDAEAEAEAPIVWPPDAKNWLIWKDPDAGKDGRQEKKGTTEDEMVGLHHWLNGCVFEQAPEVGDGQGSLACYSPWGHKKSDTTEWLNWYWLIPILLWLLPLAIHSLLFKKTLKYSWFKILYYFQVYSIVIQLFFLILFHYRLLYSINYSSLCYKVNPCCLSVLGIVIYIY